MRWLNSQPEVEDELVVEKIEHQLRTAMEADTRLGADGEWVGVLGFSQGARLAASVLYESQLRAEEAGNGFYGALDAGNVEGLAGGKWQFGVFIAGPAPFVSMRTKKVGKTMVRPGELVKQSWFDLEESQDKISLPTVHVHGLQDSHLSLHRKLMDLYCKRGTTTLIEWDGDHRLPIKSDDVRPVVEGILRAAKVRHVSRNRTDEDQLTSYQQAGLSQVVR